MKNAFKILGATPLDNREKLNELLEDKQLVCDNTEELLFAYSELATPKKRVKNELMYYSNGAFDEFSNIFDNTNVDKTKIAFDRVCDAIISVGKWLDGNMIDIFDKINTSRKVSDFSAIPSISTLNSSIAEIKNECIDNVGAYLDSTQEKTAVSLFNALIKKDDFQSFFVDELLARYEMRISGTILEKEKRCNDAFSSIERTAKAFFCNQDNLQTINKQVSDFKTALTEWDELVQPLQVNAQKHGANHDRSSEYVRIIRNNVIDLSNKSQEVLISYINRNTPIPPYASVKTIAETLYNYIFFCDIIVSLIRILQSSFAEIETTAELLKKDVVDITGLKTTLNTLVKKVDPYGSYRNSSAIKQQTSSDNIHSSESSISRSDWINENGYRFGFSIAAFICLILMIVGFSIGNNAMGVAFLVIGLSCVAFIALEKKTRGNSSVSKFIVGLTVVVLLCSVIPIAASNNNSSSSSSNSSSSSSNSSSSSSNSGGYSADTSITLTSSNFESYFTVTTSASWSGTAFKVTYNITPKSSYYANNSNSSSSISVSLKVSISSSSYGSAFKTSYINLTLYKSSGYKKSGTDSIYLNTSYSNVYWGVDVYSCSGKISK